MGASGDDTNDTAEQAPENLSIQERVINALKNHNIEVLEEMQNLDKEE